MSPGSPTVGVLTLARFWRPHQELSGSVTVVPVVGEGPVPAFETGFLPVGQMGEKHNNNQPWITGLLGTWNILVF